MERRQLEYFLAVAECGSVTRASALLHVSQPTISASLRKLESELGGMLFERSSTGLILTSAGQALLEPAGQVLRDFASASERVRAVLGLRGGRLDIVAVPAVSAGWLPGVLAAFRRSHPRVRIVITAEHDDARIAENVRNGRFNLGLAVSALNDPALVTSEVGHQDLQVTLPPGHDGEGEPIDIDQLLELDLITVSRDRSTSRRWFEAELRRRGLQPPDPIELGSVDGILPLVREGVGYALLWTPMMAPSLLGGCTSRPLRPAFRRAIHVVRRVGPHPPATEAFLRAAGIANDQDGERRAAAATPPRTPSGPRRNP